MERRFLSVKDSPVNVETREGSTPEIVGYAAVYFDGTAGTEYFLGNDWDGNQIWERVMPGAFDRAIKEDDVRALFNHDANYVLGRTTASTLRISSDSRGLFYVINPPAARNDVVESVRRRDVTGSSYAFNVQEETWRDEGNGKVVRELKAMELFDVSPVTYPAYESTTAGMRADGGNKDALDSLKKFRAAQAEAQSQRQLEIDRAVGRYNILARAAEVESENL